MNNGAQTMKAQINIPLDKMDDVTCIKCGHGEFQPTQRLKYVNAIISPNGKAGIVTVNIIRCIKCGYPFQLQEWDAHQKKIISTPN